ncbi:MAG: sensor histidine kinase [Rhodanobacteraceae bacterium]
MDPPIFCSHARPRLAVLLVGFMLAVGVSAAVPIESIVEEGGTALGHWQIVGIVLLIVVQGALITALLTERRARIRAVAGNLEQRAELAHGSRLAIVGQLSASIAHEINQPLGAILANTDAAGMIMSGPAPNLSEVRAILADIRKDGLRASEVIRRVRTLARKRQHESVPVDLRALCEDILGLIAPDARRRGITIRAELDPNLPMVRGDAVYLQQVMLNLVMNAMDALIDVPSAQATIKVRASSPRQGEVEISVRDHGKGVPDPHLPRLFDSFFSTKAHGLGIGLSIVRSIIESHGGHVVVENHPGGGAQFRFTIPADETAGDKSAIAMHPTERTA